MASNQRGYVSTLPPLLLKLFKLLYKMITIHTPEATNQHTVQTKRFYKDELGDWYIDLPEYIEAGIGTKANLQMVSGADKWLDKLSNNTSEVTVTFSGDEYEGYEDVMRKSYDFPLDTYLDDNDQVMEDLSLGMWYTTSTLHQLWLCPVTLYVFGGNYPEKIYYSVKK